MKYPLHMQGAPTWLARKSDLLMRSARSRPFGSIAIGNQGFRRPKEDKIADIISAHPEFGRSIRIGKILAAGAANDQIGVPGRNCSASSGI
jgi:hypothetical protein